MTGDGSREPNRRPVLKGLGASVIVPGLAGCLSDSGGDDGGDPTATDESGRDTAEGGDTETPEAGDDGDTTPAVGDDSASTPPATEQVVLNSFEGLEISSHEGTVDDESYEVTFTVENTGDQVTSIDGYKFRLSLYDASGAELTDPASLVFGKDGDLEPGDTTDIRIVNDAKDAAEDVARYQIRMECGSFDEGVYCTE